MKQHQICEQDQLELDELRADLKDVRMVLGLKQEEVAARAGRSIDFIARQEQVQRISSQLSSLQRWAGAYDMRVEFGLEDFWLHSHDDSEMLTLFTMSRRFDADDWARLWVVSALRVLRLKRQLSPLTVARSIGATTGEAVTRWELEGHDPLVNRVFIHARAVQTRLTMQLWHRKDWKFG